MSKKTLLCYIVCVLFLLTACSGKLPPTFEQEAEVSNSSNKQETLSAGDAPREIRFDSISEIGDFLSSEVRTQVNSSAETAEKSIYQYETQTNAVEFAEAANMVYYPVADVESGLSYHPVGPDGPCLSFIYVVDGIQYTFLYFFECQHDWVREDDPVFSCVQVGPYTVDFYREEYRFDEANNYLLGHIVIDGMHLTVTVKGDGCEEFDFSIFDFVPLSASTD